MLNNRLSGRFFIGGTTVKYILFGIIVYLLFKQLDLKDQIQQLNDINEDTHSECLFWRKSYMDAVNKKD